MRYAQTQPWTDGQPGFYTAISGVRMVAPADFGRGDNLKKCCGVDAITIAFQDKKGTHWQSLMNENGFIEQCDCGMIYPIRL